MNKVYAVILILLTTLPGFAQSGFVIATGNLPASATGGNTMDVKAADLNGDGFPDIVLAKEWQRNRILFNDGTGHFTDVTLSRLSNVNHDSEDIALSDLDNNGWLDIVFASEDDSTHEMYINTGFGSFIDVSDRLPHFVSNAVVTVDINGDGYMDLIFGNNGQDRILINDGTGHFTDETSVRMPVSNNVTQDILLVDVDNDGDWDLATANEDGNCLLINDGTGVFTDETMTRLATAINMESRKVSKADVNGDGYDDLFFSNMTSAAGEDIQDRLYLNDGTGHYTDATTLNLPVDDKHTFDAVFTDFNGDSKPDLLVGYLPNEPPAILINDGTGKFADHSGEYLPAGATGSNIGLIVADLNDDGKDDIYLGRFQQTDALLLYTSNVGIDDKIIPEGLSVYQDAAHKSITITLNDECLMQKTIATITDMAGKEITRQSTRNGKQILIPTEGLAPGTYMLCVRAAACSASQKLMIAS